MAQHDYVIANGTGAAVRSDLNNALAAIVSQNSGATAPATTYAFQFWADTTTGLLKLRNSANSAWVTLFQLDGEWSTLPVENGTAAAPSIYFKDSGTDTGFYSPGTDQVAISTGGTGRLFINSSGSVGIGTSTPGTALDVNGAIRSNDIFTLYKNSTDAFYIGAGTIITGGTSTDIALRSNQNGSILFSTNGATERMRIDASGRVGIGTTSPASDLQISGSGDRSVLVTGGTSGTVSVQLGDSAATGQGGIYYDNSVDGLFLKSNGSERARIDSSGRFLVGTSTSLVGAGSIAAFLQVSGTSSAAGASFTRFAGANAGGPTISLNKTRSSTQGTFSAVLSGDNLGDIFFNGDDGAAYQIGAGILAEADANWAAGDCPGRLVFSTTADGASSPTERMRINSLGRVLLNNAIGQDPWAATGSVDAGAYFGAGDNFGLAVNSRSIPLLVNRTNTTGTIQEFKYNGSITGYITTSASAITITYSSDYRLKENVIPLTNAVSRIKQLQPKRFNYIVEPEITVDGFLAHEAQNVVPEAVVGTYNQVNDNGDPVYQGIDPSKMVPLLTAALQEAIAKIESLEARLTAAGI